MLVQHFLEASAARHPDKTALVAGSERLTYAELDARANALAHALAGLGVRRGDRVAIQLENGVECVVSLFATLKAGGAYMVLNPSMKPGKLGYVLRDSGAVALVTDAGHLARLAAAGEEAPDLRHVLLTDAEAASETVGGIAPLSFGGLIADRAGVAGPPAVRCIDADLASLIYTSGSTGEPKGVISMHRNIVAASGSIIEYLGNTPDDVILSALPLAFDYGLYQLLMCMRFGGTLVLERSFAFPAAVLQKVAAEKVTCFPIVPTMLAMLLRLDLSKFDLSGLRYLSNTGAALPVEHIRRLRGLLPHLTVFSMYGLTECKRASYLPPDQIDIRPSSIGKGMPNSELYLVDDDGRPIEGAGEGELVVRGSNVMPGYWRQPETTARTFRDGPVPGEKVLFTGDTFRRDEDGFYYFVGRRDEMIKSRGERVSPREIENVLCELPEVAEAAVIGVPDPILGQSIRAYLVLRGDAALTDRAVLRHCAVRLEDFAVPQRVFFRDALPLGNTGKIDKKALLAEALAEEAAA